MKPASPVETIFGNKTRLRVCGIHIQGSSVLMVKHKGLGESGYLWAPPGGGMEFGVSAEENLIREFQEETGLSIKVQQFLFIHEFIAPPLHAVELFFIVEVINGTLKAGHDPELNVKNQIIEEVKYLDWKELEQLKNGHTHQIFSRCKDLAEIINLRGYFLFQNNYIK